MVKGPFRTELAVPDLQVEPAIFWFGEDAHAPLNIAMREFINLVHLAEASAWAMSFEELAAKCDTVEQFIYATDGKDVLYRGHSGDTTANNSFMTDYVGHAAQYTDDTGKIDAFAYNANDVYFFNDQHFDEMRRVYNRLENNQFDALYKEALVGSRFANSIDYRKDVRMARKIIQSDVPYSEISGIPERNDTVVPLMQKYARDVHSKNIIAFHGNDYADYGGQTEYVVGDVSKLLDLRKLYATVRGQM